MNDRELEKLKHTFKIEDEPENDEDPEEHYDEIDSLYNLEN